MNKNDSIQKLFMTDELDNEIELLMHPEKDRRMPKITLIFAFEKDEKPNEEFEEKLTTIKDYSNFFKSNNLFYRIDFEFFEVKKIYETHQLIKDLPHKEVLINNQKLPYSGSLWLMLMWFYL